MKRFKNILCVIKPDEASWSSLERAVTLAQNNQATLTVVDVVEEIAAGIGISAGGPISADLQASVVSDHERAMETLLAPFRSRIAIGSKVLVGVSFLEIIREVLRSEHDLVIKVPEEHDWFDRFFGSDDMHLLRKCPCPVWLIKPGAPKAYRRILAAVDVDEGYPPAEMASRRELNDQVLAMAASQALSDFAELHVVNAWEAVAESAMRGAFMNTSEEKIQAYVEQARQRHQTNLEELMREVIGGLGQDAVNYLKPQVHLVKGRGRKEIPALAKGIDADLVVMGTVARTGIPGFIMGNTAETILNQIDCSVLAVKPPGFTTPVTLVD